MAELAEQIKEIVTVAGIVIAASVAAFNWRSGRFRGKLKDDLEIQKRYREELEALGRTPSEVAEDEHYQILRAKVHRKMKKAYVLRGTDWSDAAIAVCLFCIALYASKYDLPFAPGRQTLTASASFVLGAVFVFLAVRNRGRERE